MKPFFKFNINYERIAWIIVVRSLSQTSRELSILLQVQKLWCEVAPVEEQNTLQIVGSGRGSLGVLLVGYDMDWGEL